jgi:hypothetical protein
MAVDIREILSVEYLDRVYRYEYGPSTSPQLFKTGHDSFTKL